MSATMEMQSYNGLDSLAEESVYALQEQSRDRYHIAFVDEAQDTHRDDDPKNPMDGNRRSAYGGSRGRVVNSNGQPVRRRISRACDQCNQSRTKCDGKYPCAHCIEFSLKCEYAREQKKRGKASKKDLAAQQATSNTMPQSAMQDTSPKSTRGAENGAMDDQFTLQDGGRSAKRVRREDDFPRPQLYAANSSKTINYAGHDANLQDGSEMERTGSSTGDFAAQKGGNTKGERSVIFTQPSGITLPVSQASNTDHTSLIQNDFGTYNDYQPRVLDPIIPGVTGLDLLHSGGLPMPHTIFHGGTISGYGENAYAATSPPGHAAQQGASFKFGGSPLPGDFMRQSSMGNSPGSWFSMPSPSAALLSGTSLTAASQALRYPILRPLLPYISSIIPVGLACDLLDFYFASTSSAFMHPQSPYILGFVFRKRSFLRQNNPRPTSSALLASMLWVAAQTSESAFLTSTPSARGKVCQKLMELTIGLLKPLIHTPANREPRRTSLTNPEEMGLGQNVLMHVHTHDNDTVSPVATGSLDDIATYIHLATVVSASEYKAASLRWWNAAWSLARELKLGRELPPQPEQQQNMDLTDGNADPANAHQPSNGSSMVSEEEREERRRVWWLLYIMDRHLALCYNRPLFLLDVECEGLYIPEDDTTWQAGEYYSSENMADTNLFRVRGSTFECSGHSIFGFFLPLMVILGEIVDLHHARNHPRFGLRFRGSDELNSVVQDITQQLEAYGRSLKEFEARHVFPHDQQSQQKSAGANVPAHNGEWTTTSNEPKRTESTSPSVHSAATGISGSRITETILQARIVVAYGTHLMHTLHILLNGKWDPIELLDDDDLWISSPSFLTATGHAVAAADAISDILDLDPDLSAMPFFFGIYLLQGSFLLLLIADKLQADASPNVVRACESIVRAHEACVVTLNTEYQRNFRKVMRSALASVRGRTGEGSGEQHLRRREVLALYRWTGDGTGLAL